MEKEINGHINRADRKANINWKESRYHKQRKTMHNIVDSLNNFAAKKRISQQ